MSFLHDIRVNGQQSSATTVPTIEGLHPVINWAYEEDAADWAQNSYMLKIGTSSVAWETDSFSGDIADVSEASGSNSYEHLLHNLTRGNTYYGQAKAADPQGDETPWAAFAFTTNTLPFVTNFSLSPSSPEISEDLELSYTYSDADGHDEAGTKIRWFRNNLPVPAYDDLCILPSSATSSGESWTAKIIPSDGLEFGAMVETASVTIQDIQSTFESITILPTDANVDDILTVEWEVTETEYISLTGTVSFEWYINDTAVPDSDKQYIRLRTSPGDSVVVVLSLTQSDGTVLAAASSEPKVIADVDWHIFDLTVNELREAINITDLSPILEWKVFKSTAEANETPLFSRVLVTKTPSMSGPIYDSSSEYTKNSFVIPSGILSRGQNYYVHVGAADTTPIPNDNFVRKEVNILGSSWDENVSNNTGWTVETKFRLLEGITDPMGGTVPEGTLPRFGVYIHDGAKFCAITFEQRKVIFHSTTIVEEDLPTDQPDLLNAKTFRIAGQNSDVKIFMNNKLLLDATGLFTNESRLKFIEYGDIDGKYSSEAIVRFFRYSTSGAFGIGESLPNENTYYFFDVGQIEGGQIQYVESNMISWLPEESGESAKLLRFNENSEELQLPTVTKNFSPITSIFVDKNHNKYVGTANGLNAIYGAKHDPDYEFSTSDTNIVITTDDFDRITTVDLGDLSVVEPDSKAEWFTLDTTFRSIGVTETTGGFFTGDPYDPYRFGITSHAVHYYSQRSHGHAWYDKVDNSKGWQIAFSFQLEHLEQEDFQEQNIDHQGFGIYVNDGTRQEILYFYQDRIRLYYANVYVPVVTSTARNYRIVGKDDNIFIYQKLDNPAISSYQLLINGTGLFTTPASVAGNSRRPKVAFDSSGLYHAVWHDDGNARSQIFYSTYDGSSWSHPQIIANSKFDLRNPSLAVDDSGRVWVAYEDTSWGQTEISVSVLDDVGWNTPTRVTNARSNKRNPAIAIDVFDNVHVVWEDDRNGTSQIFWCQRERDRQAWISSGQFGDDTIVMQQRSTDDPYLQGAIQIKNPQIAHDHPRLWLVAEVIDEGNHTSSIYRSVYNTETERWQGMGVPQFNDDGDYLGEGTSTLVSLSGRNCHNPAIAASSTKGVVVVWEDQTAPVTQIWGSSSSTLGIEFTAPTAITDRIADCKNPAVGWVSNQAPILFESDGQIYLANYSGNTRLFDGSAVTSDELLQISGDREAGSPAIANHVPAKNFKAVYQFLREKTTALESVEFPDYYLVGDMTVAHEEDESEVVTTETLSDGIVSDIDTKEFAFGDMSENIALLAHWKDISFYFGYDARPYSISKFNSGTVFGWGDDRINDIFVDTFGNVIVAKYDGLFYHNVFTGELTDIEGREAQDSTCPNGCHFRTSDGPKVITAIAWGGNGAWYVGSTDGIYLSTSAGQTWSKFTVSLPSAVSNLIVHRISIDKDGKGVCATNAGVVIVSASDPTGSERIPIAQNLPQTSGITDDVRAIGVDDNDVIWAGGNRGLIRIENKKNFLYFNRKSGMRASHVTDVAIVNKHLRYIATANGVDRMHGTTFSGISTQTHEILNNNISQLAWDEERQSLWVASLHTLHEIVFHDLAHEIIADEIVQYDSTELLTDESFENDTYTVLDIEEIQQADENLQISPESISVMINKNPIDFGFAVGELGKSVTFLTSLLPYDEVEVKVSNRFIKFHDFNQTDIEQRVIGEKRTSIQKIVKTFSRNQTLLLTGEDKYQVLLLAEESVLPFTTVLLDRDLPVGCFRRIETLTPTTLKFKILASDALSGIDGYMLSNYENFTSDGETPLDFATLPQDGVVTHSIGAAINNVTTSLTFPSETTLPDLSTSSVGTGAALGTWTDIDANTTYLMAATSSPPIVWRFNPETETWASLWLLDSNASRIVTDMHTFNNVLFVATAVPGSGSDVGVVYRTTDGSEFEVAATSSTSSDFNSIASALDGTLYFADGAGAIYSYKDGTSELVFTGIGDAIESIGVWNNVLIAGTGNNSRVYMLDLETLDNLVVFVGEGTTISNVHIKDSQFAPSAQEAKLFASSGESTTIYRSDLATFDFVKSFNSVNREIHRIKTIDRAVLEENPDSSADITQVVAAMGDSLFKQESPSWEFFHLHDEEIYDFIQYGPPGSEGIYLISESKVNKWTSKLEEKTVYLKLRDKAGNVSSTPDLDTVCPAEGADISDENGVFCCTNAYSLRIADLKEFVHESRIVDVTEYGEIIFTYSSPTDHVFYSADEIDQEIGIYTSEVLNGSNDLVSWKTITWVATEPSGTSVDLQIRYGATQDDTEEAEWSADLVQEANGLVSIEHITDQYVQFRAILKSSTRDLSPTLTSVTIRNLTTQASHFFTTNFIMSSRAIKGLLTANTFIPVSADVVFGINTKNSVDFGDYQIIEPNRLFTTTQGQFGEDFRIGVKLLSPGIPQLSQTSNPGDPYDASTFVCTVAFAYENTDVTYKNFHFRVRFYNDPFRTQLIYTFFTGNDQTGWSHGAGDDTFPANGLTIGASETATISFEPADRIETNQRWYVTIDAWDGSSFETVLDDRSYICSACNITNDPGLVSEYYKTGLPSALTSIPQFANFTPDYTLLEDNVYFPETFGDWTTTKGQVLSGYDDHFAARFFGKIQAPTAGSYTFQVQSSDGIILFIDAEEIINNDNTGGSETVTGSIFLTEGFHDIDLHYFDATGGAELILSWITPGESSAVVVPLQRFFHAVASEYCDDSSSPIVYNFAILFELENGETVKINLTP